MLAHRTSRQLRTDFSQKYAKSYSQSPPRIAPAASSGGSSILRNLFNFN